METVVEIRKLNQRLFNNDLYVTDFICVDGNPHHCQVGIVNATQSAWINALTFNNQQIDQEELDRVETMLLEWYPNAKDMIRQHDEIENLYKENKNV